MAQEVSPGQEQEDQGETAAEHVDAVGELVVDGKGQRQHFDAEPG